MCVPSSELGLPPPPFPLASVSLPPESRGGGGHTSLRVRGGGVRIPTTGDKA